MSFASEGQGSSSPAPSDAASTSRAAKPRGTSISLKQQLISPPNLVTYVRIIAIPAVLVFMQIDGRGNAFTAAMIFALASASDALDGYLARRYKLVSDLGKFLDPLADKLIVMGALVMLVHLSRVSAWIVILLLSREMIVSGLRSVAANEGLVIAARPLGKQKTAFQMVGLWCLLVHYAYVLPPMTTPVDFHRVGMVFLYISVFFAIISMIDYFTGFARAVTQRNRQES